MGEHSHSRRAFLASALAGIAVGPAALAQEPLSGFADEEINPEERRAMEEPVRAYMKRYDAPGISIAIARNGRIAYADAFGVADRETGETVTPRSLFRICSITKPITSVTLFTLVEAGKLRLTDRVFGKGAILGTEYGTQPYGPGIEQITIEHLMTHTAGGWTNDGSDPMYQSPEMNHARLISWTLDNMPLKNPPGTKYAYSNFGYCLLGRVIEKLTGASYDTFVKRRVLSRCGVRDMSIGGNTLAARKPNEVVYCESPLDPYSQNVTRMDSHGGWIASATDLVHFALHADGFPTVPDLLKPETMRLMTTPTTINPGYAKGWAVNSVGNWWHSGSLFGSSTVMVRTATGFCWAGLVNARKGDSVAALDRLMWEVVGKVGAWRA